MRFITSLAVVSGFFSDTRDTPHTVL